MDSFLCVQTGSDALKHLNAFLELVDVLVDSKLATSKREARQFITDGAVTLNGEALTEKKSALEKSDFTHNVALLKRGKRNVCVLVLS